MLGPVLNSTVVACVIGSVQLSPDIFGSSLKFRVFLFLRSCRLPSILVLVSLGAPVLRRRPSSVPPSPPRTPRFCPFRIVSAPLPSLLLLRLLRFLIRLLTIRRRLHARRLNTPNSHLGLHPRLGHVLSICHIVTITGALFGMRRLCFAGSLPGRSSKSRRSWSF